MEYVNIELGTWLEKESKLVLVESVGVSSNLDDDVKQGTRYIRYLINEEDCTLYERASITSERLIELGFERDKTCTDYKLSYQGQIVIICFETENLLASPVFKYKKRNGELIPCKYIDEIQKNYKLEDGHLLTLSLNSSCG